MQTYAQRTKRKPADPVLRGNTEAVREMPNSIFGAGVSSQADISDPNLLSKIKSRQSDIPGRMQAQIPTAEREADSLSSGIGIGMSSPEAVKDEMGKRLGADLSGVQFHTDSKAEGYADSIGARAYTTGSDIYFGEGGFDPAVAAHELVHTAQQGVTEAAVPVTAAPMGGVQMWPWSKKKTKTPLGTSMPKLSSTPYSSGEMGSRISALAPVAKEQVAASSQGVDSDSGNRFFYMRGSEKGDVRDKYFDMLKNVGRGANISTLGKMSKGVGSLPDLGGAGSYKDLEVSDEPDSTTSEKDKAKRRKARPKYQKQALKMTKHYLSSLEENPDAIDALRQGAGMYEGFGKYSETNKAGMVAGKEEAAHRVMNDMILRSFGPDTVIGRRDLGLQEKDDKKVGVVGQAMAAMQPSVLAAVMNPEKAKELTEPELELMQVYRSFFLKHGLIDAPPQQQQTGGTQPTTQPTVSTIPGSQNDYTPQEAELKERLRVMNSVIGRDEDNDADLMYSMAGLKGMPEGNVGNKLKSDAPAQKKKKWWQFWK